MCHEGERVMQAKEKIVVYEICEECHGNGFIRPNRFADKDIDTTYVCNICNGSGHTGKHYE